MITQIQVMVKALTLSRVMGRVKRRENPPFPHSLLYSTRWARPTDRAPVQPLQEAPP